VQLSLIADVGNAIKTSIKSRYLKDLKDLISYRQQNAINATLEYSQSKNPLSELPLSF